MQLTFVRPWKSIIELPTSEPLTQLTVLTGPNGAGKSQILDAIEAGALQVDGIPTPGVTGQVRVFRLSELMAQVEPPQAMSSYRERWAQVAQHIRSMVDGNRPNYHGNQAALDQMVMDNVRANKMLSEGALHDLLAFREKPLSEYSLDDIRDGLPLMHAEVDPFRLSIAEVFGTYFLRRDNNTYQRYKKSEGLEYAPFLSDGEFNEKYGPPPWDVLNQALLAIGLNYAFERPVQVSETIPYVPTLRHREEGVDLSVESLSAGERTLLAIALSLYTGSTKSSSYLQLPRVLLLDEADASLHPSMVVGLLKVLQDIFIETHGVSVFMTTHSPTTVALAPEECLYAMRRGSGPRLRKISKDQAIAALAVGIPTLSVRVDDRRTIIVEEKDDAQIYELYYRLLKSKLRGPWSLQFVPSGSGSAQHPENSGSATEVRRLVREMRAGGNETVFGLIDRDQSTVGTETILVSPERYSIENFVLDPLLVAAFLLMQNLVPATELGIPDQLRHFQLSGEHAAEIVSTIAAKLGFNNEATHAVSYEGGFVIHVPDSFLNMRGHDLESAYTSRYPMLRRYPKLLNSVTELAARDVPQYIPGAVRALFDRLA